MSESKKSGVVKQIFDRIRHANVEEHSPSSQNNARLGYVKGNLSQDKPKNTEVWDSCPVLDEQGNPISDK